MSTSKNRSKKKLGPLNRRLTLVIFCALLCLSLVSGIVAKWSPTSTPFKPSSLTTAGPVPAPTLSPEPAKEYIYAGDRLLVTEGPPNVGPTVSITSPANNAVYNDPESITIDANASDPDGAISKVEFFQGSTLLNTDTTAPYSFAWTNVPAGTYSLTAKATDNTNLTTTSSAITIISNALPSVSISSPANDAVFNAPASITIDAGASDSDGAITKVEFFQGSTLLNTDTTAPYSFAWANVPFGTYSLTARATDDRNAVTTSSAITVISNALPTVVITSPPNNAVFTAPANILIEVSASDPDGAITKVEFFQGSTLLNTDTVAPFGFTWTNVPAGTYSLTAKATDNRNAVTTSSAAIVSSNVPPTVSITSPANNTVFTAPASITIDASANDADGTITKVEFFQGSTLLNTDTTAPYSFTWTNVPAGTYSLTAKATDNNNLVTTSSAITVISNVPPTVSITSPANNAVFTAPASITIDASASDSDGAISKVEFFQGSTLLNTDTTAPYSFTWTNVPTGTYSLTAKATDNRNAVTTSSAITVISNVPPTVSITSPANNTVFTAPASITIDASASDSNGTVSKVEFFQGTTLLNTDTTAPYSFTWTNVPAGTYSLTAKATDNHNAVTTSSAITVISNALPTVSITNPANNTVFTAPATIMIDANANDSDGTISKVEFFQGTTLLNTDTTAPFSFTWTNVPAGTYSLTAKATDNRNAVTTSSAIAVISNALPTVSITSPANNAVFNAPANITIDAGASDSDGTISKVEFFQGTTLLNTDTTAPFSFAWTNVPAGTYSLTAKATDNRNAVTTSSAITVISNAAPAVSITSPANHSMFAPASNITINATSSDADGTITQVDFYSGATLLGTDNSSPYSFTLNNAASGWYPLTARATDNRNAVTISSVVVVTTPTFFDDFNDNSLNTTKWAILTPGSPATVTEQSQQLRITVPTGVATYNGVISNSSYDLRGAIAQVEMVQSISQAGWVENSLKIEKDANNYLLINAGSGSTMFRSRTNGADDQLIIPFDSVAHRYWRVRHDSATNIVYFETSTDGALWSIRKTATPGFSLATVKFSLIAGAWAGNNPSPGTAIYNDFQFIASATPPACTPPTGLIISEFRLRGPNGSNDEYVELYNNTGQSITVCTADGSSGWAVVSAEGTTRFVVNSQTVIPARAHYLATAAGYSLAAYGGSASGDLTYSTDIPDNTGLALFNTSNAANFNTTNRLDAVGFSTSGTLYREGTGLALLGANGGQFAFLRKLNSATPQDTGDNLADFTLVATDAGTYGSWISILGAPGPENLLSPIEKTASLAISGIDPAVGLGVAPNRVRDTAAIGPNAAAGTFSFRRTVTNNTGMSVTRLRFRIIDITTLNTPGYTPGGAQSDMRLLNCNDFTATITGGQQVLVRGTTVEVPPSQSLAGGLNSSMTVTLAQPLAPGQSISVQLLLGVQQAGTFRFFFTADAIVQ